VILSEHELREMLKEIARLRKINADPWTSDLEIGENLSRLRELKARAELHLEALTPKPRLKVV
jgi:hypothetical protein